MGGLLASSVRLAFLGGYLSLTAAGPRLLQAFFQQLLEFICDDDACLIRNLASSRLLLPGDTEQNSSVCLAPHAEPDLPTDRLRSCQRLFGTTLQFTEDQANFRMVCDRNHLPPILIQDCVLQLQWIPVPAPGEVGYLVLLEGKRVEEVRAVQIDCSRQSS